MPVSRTRIKCDQVLNVFLLVSAYLAEYDYLAKSSDELSLRKGDILTNAVRSEHGWLKGECRGKIGCVELLLVHWCVSFRFVLDIFRRTSSR